MRQQDIFVHSQGDSLRPRELNNHFKGYSLITDFMHIERQMDVECTERFLKKNEALTAVERTVHDLKDQ
jgi:hypothetical protein